MLRATVDSKGADSVLNKIKLIITDESFDKPVAIAGWRVQRDLVLLTPKKWTGILRRRWGVTKPKPGQRLVSNSSKVMLFLEGGTGMAGTATSHGGYIYPKTKRCLFIPLNARAAIGGWNSGLVFGTDYVLAKRARGIKAMRIVEKYRPKAREILKEEMKNFLAKELR